MAVDYVERAREGLIKQGGFVDLSSIQPDDRRFMEFLEQRNRVKARVLLSQQWKIARARHAEREGRPFVNRSYRSAEEAAAAAAGRPPPRTPPISAALHNTLFLCTGNRRRLPAPATGRPPAPPAPAIGNRRQPPARATGAGNKPAPATGHSIRDPRTESATGQR